MDNDLLFLENLSNLLEQGYGIEETLLICKDINSHPSIDTILQKIYDGEDLTDALLDIYQDYLLNSLPSFLCVLLFLMQLRIA